MPVAPDVALALYQRMGIDCSAMRCRTETVGFMDKIRRNVATVTGDITSLRGVGVARHAIMSLDNDTFFFVIDVDTVRDSLACDCLRTAVPRLCDACKPLAVWRTRLLVQQVCGSDLFSVLEPDGTRRKPTAPEDVASFFSGRKGSHTYVAKRVDVCTHTLSPSLGSLRALHTPRYVSCHHTTVQQREAIYEHLLAGFRKRARDCVVHATLARRLLAPETDTTFIDMDKAVCRPDHSVRMPGDLNLKDGERAIVSPRSYELLPEHYEEARVAAHVSPQDELLCIDIAVRKAMALSRRRRLLSSSSSSASPAIAPAPVSATVVVASHNANVARDRINRMRQSVGMTLPAGWDSDSDAAYTDDEGTDNGRFDLLGELSYQSITDIAMRAAKLNRDTLPAKKSSSAQKADQRAKELADKKRAGAERKAAKRARKLELAQSKKKSRTKKRSRSASPPPASKKRPATTSYESDDSMASDGMGADDSMGSEGEEDLDFVDLSEKSNADAYKHAKEEYDKLYEETNDRQNRCEYAHALALALSKMLIPDAASSTANNTLKLFEGINVHMLAAVCMLVSTDAEVNVRADTMNELKRQNEMLFKPPRGSAGKSAYTQPTRAHYMALVDLCTRTSTLDRFAMPEPTSTIPTSMAQLLITMLNFDGTPTPFKVGIKGTFAWFEAANRTKKANKGHKLHKSILFSNVIVAVCGLQRILLEGNTAYNMATILHDDQDWEVSKVFWHEVSQMDDASVDYDFEIRKSDLEMSESDESELSSLAEDDIDIYDSDDEPVLKPSKEKRASKPVKAFEAGFATNDVVNAETAQMAAEKRREKRERARQRLEAKKRNKEGALDDDDDPPKPSKKRVASPSPARPTKRRARKPIEPFSEDSGSSGDEDLVPMTAERAPLPSSKPKADKPKADKPKADKPKADKPKADKPKPRRRKQPPKSAEMIEDSDSMGDESILAQPDPEPPVTPVPVVADDDDDDDETTDETPPEEEEEEEEDAADDDDDAVVPTPAVKSKPAPKPKPAPAKPVATTNDDDAVVSDDDSI